MNSLYDSIPSPDVIPSPRLLQFARRSFLPMKRDCLWKLESGVVRTLTWLEDGTVVTLGLWGPGEILGGALAQMDPYQIECLTVVEASLLPAAHMPLEPQLWLARVQQVETLLVIRSHKRVEDMLLKLLVWLADRFGSEATHGRVIDLRITHQDMAELLGTTRVTITRLLKQFESEGIIQRLIHQRILLKQEEFWYYEI